MIVMLEKHLAYAGWIHRLRFSVGLLRWVFLTFSSSSQELDRVLFCVNEAKVNFWLQHKANCEPELPLIRHRGQTECDSAKLPGQGQAQKCQAGKRRLTDLSLCAIKAKAQQLSLRILLGFRYRCLRYYLTPVPSMKESYFMQPNYAVILIYSCWFLSDILFLYESLLCILQAVNIQISPSTKTRLHPFELKLSPFMQPLHALCVI